MGAAIALRADYCAVDLRQRAKASKDAAQTMWAKASFSAFDAPIEVTCENKGKPIGDYEIGVFDPHTGEPKTVGEDVLPRGSH